MEHSGRFWDCIFCPGPMTLAALANNQDEQAAFQRILSKYPNTTKGYLQALHHFTPLYIATLKGSISLKSIGLVKSGITEISHSKKIVRSQS